MCHISQSGISQSIRALEDEIGAKLLIRKNRKFELTEAGKHFYKKSLVITAELEQLCRETVRIDRKDAAELSLGVLSTYSGDEFNRAIAAFSEKHPTVELIVVCKMKLFKRENYLKKSGDSIMKNHVNQNRNLRKNFSFFTGMINH